MSFARFKRPTPSDFLKAKIEKNNSTKDFPFHNEFKEHHAKQRDHSVRNSGYRDRRLSPNEYFRPPSHSKNLSRGNLAGNKLSQSLTYDRNSGSYDKLPEVSANLAPEMDQHRELEHTLPKYNTIDATDELPKRKPSPYYNNRSSREKPPQEGTSKISVGSARKSVQPVSPEQNKRYKAQKADKLPRKEYDSLDYHMNHGMSAKNTGPRSTSNLKQHNATYTEGVVDFDSIGAQNFKRSTTREDVHRHSIEQDRYYKRLDNMNAKQNFEKYLSDHLMPNKDKEKHLEEIERLKRDEAK